MPNSVNKVSSKYVIVLSFFFQNYNIKGVEKRQSLFLSLESL